MTILNLQPAEERLKSIPCSRTPLAGGRDRAALQEAVILLQRPDQRAMAFCLLGDYPSALAAYAQAASTGDGWSALQTYFLQARLGNMSAAEQALSRVYTSAGTMLDFSSDVAALNLNIDLLPIAQRAVELYPNDPDSWKLWLGAAQVYGNASDWLPALDADLEAIQAQENLGVNIGRSSFELGAGRTYEISPGLRDLTQALIYDNLAITSMDFLDASELSSAFLYRGEVYLGLSPAYSATQALHEYLHSLDLDPQNYWAMRAIASVYLYNLKDYLSAELYINRAITLNPDLYDAYVIRGDLFRAQGNLPNAIVAYQDALSRHPGDQDTLDRLAAVKTELKKISP